MAAPVTFESFQQELTRLVARFSAGATGFLARDYAEASVRQDFIDPFFTALGWDLKNERQLILNKREVEIESRTLIDGRKKRADYLFRIDGTDRFVCEAKKPFETLGSNHAFQAKRYARNKVLPLALLTDFEELCLYVVAIKPRRSDPVNAGLWKKWHYSEYPSHAREIWDLLSREAVAGGAIDRGLAELPKNPTGKGRARQLWLIRPDRTRAIDADFLAFLDESRRTLGSDLLRHNPHANLRDDLPRLNEAVQRILDRLLFLRICEDRDIDTGLVLNRAVENWFHATGDPRAHRATQDDLPGVNEPPTGTPTLSTHQLWPRLVEHFQELDRRPASSVPFFNGHLFKPHFTEDLLVGDDWLADFLDDLGGDESEYLFSVIPVEILGTIYERFLGKVIRPQGLGVTIEEKPEVRKAGGVYYTPRYIVDYIVEQTVGKLLDDQPPEKTLALRLLDPACGSGSFLIRVFERVCEHWQTWLTRQLPAKAEAPAKADWEKLVDAPVGAKPAAPRTKDARAAWLAQNREFCWLDEASGDLHLTMHLKRRILIANIYGVDLDPGAVEVTQLSLYLKMLENENRDTLARERQLFADEAEPALLPPLAANIKRGNSLIASDFSLDSDELVRVRAFDWNVGFKKIMSEGGFDAVVGNPPYGAELSEADTHYLKETYTCAEYQIDTYPLFIERAKFLLNPSALIGMIIPSAWVASEYNIGFRRLLLEELPPSEIVVAPKNVFQDATVETVILISGKTASASGNISIERWDLTPRKSYDLSFSRISTNEALIFPIYREPAVDRLIEKLASTGRKFNEVSEAVWGIKVYQRGKGKPAQKGTESTSRCFHSDQKSKPTHRKIIGGSEVRRYDLNWSGGWVDYGPWLAEPRSEDWFHGDRIAIREVTANGDIQAAFTDKPFVFSNSVDGLRTKQKSSVPLQFLLALLSSKLISFYNKNTSANAFKGTFPKVLIKDLLAFPLPRHLEQKRHDRLVALVDKMLVLTPKLRAATDEHTRATLQNAVTATDNQIDQLVYELYALTPEEIALVEGSHAPAPASR